MTGTAAKTSKTLPRRLDRLASQASPYVPFTAPHDVRVALGRAPATVLDVGCGDGERMGSLNGAGRLRAIGVDIFLPYLHQARRRQSHAAYVLCDVRNMPFKEKSFDLVLCLEVIEHLEREEALALILAMERLARWRVLISAPAATHVQHAYDDNPYQEHRSTWRPQDLRQLGYRVRLNGLRNSAGEGGFASNGSAAWRLTWRLASVLAGPIVNLCPRLAGHMVCWKDVEP